MNTRRIVSVSVLAALSALPLLQGCAVQEGENATASKSAPLMADDVDPSFDPLDPMAVKPPGLTTQTLEVGDGWRKVRVFGTATDVDTGKASNVDRTLVVVQDKKKIATAPVASFVKTDVAAELAAPTPLATKAGVLAKVAPPDEEVLIVDVAAANDAQAVTSSGTPTVMYSCSDSDKTLEKTVSTTKTYGEPKTFGPGDFSGRFDGTATLTASATAKAVVRVKKKWCIPYGVSFKYAQVTGNAEVSMTGHLDGTFAKAFKYDKKLAQPSLGSLSFTVGPIPVSVNFSAPIHIGVEASAKGTVKFDGSGTGRGTFDLTCTSSGCSGSRSATFTSGPSGTPSMSVDGLVEATPYAYAGIHANLYTDWIANAEVGLKAKLRNQLWGYAGNTCGDANGDGAPEFVNAAVLDSRFGVDLVGKVSLVGSDHGPWTYPLLDTHVRYWDLLSGGSSAVSPLVSFTIPTSGGTTVDAHARMRPCWPFADAMKYQIAWGDGASDTTGFVPAASQATASHVFGAYGFKTVTATPLVDVMGRGPGRPSSRSLRLMPFVLTTLETAVLSP